MGGSTGSLARESGRGGRLLGGFTAVLERGGRRVSGAVVGDDRWHLAVSKRTLGGGYVGAVGAVLGGVVLWAAIPAVGRDPSAALTALAGLVPAVGLVALARWGPTDALAPDDVWTVATWCALGVGLLALVPVGVALSGPRPGSLAPVLLGTTLSFGAGAGATLGALLVYRRRAHRLDRGNAVLDAVIQHELRNDLTVALGQLGQLEDEVDGPATRRLEALRSTVDRIARTTDRARAVETTLTPRERSVGEVDLAALVRRRIEEYEAGRDVAGVAAVLPETAPVAADWLAGTVVDAVLATVDPDRMAIERTDSTVELVVEGHATRRDELRGAGDETPPAGSRRTVASRTADAAGADNDADADAADDVGADDTDDELWLAAQILSGYPGGDLRDRHRDGRRVVTLSFRAAEGHRSDGSDGRGATDEAPFDGRHF